MRVTINEECLTCNWDEYEPLMRFHYAEIDGFSVHRNLNINKDAYDQYAMAGMLRTIAVRSEDDRLIGYLIALVSVSLHCMDVKQARVDAVYLSPEARRGMIGYNLIKVADKFLAGLGVNEIHHSVPVVRDFGAILERLGYSKAETIYSKNLGV